MEQDQEMEQGLGWLDAIIEEQRGQWEALGMSSEDAAALQEMAGAEAWEQEP